MKNYLSILSLLFLALGFMCSCSDEMPMEEDPILPEPIEINTTLGQYGTVNFEFDECNILEQNSTGSATYANQSFDVRKLQTNLSKNGIELSITLRFLLPTDQNLTIESILLSDINDQNNPNLALEIEVTAENKNYSSTSISVMNGQYSFIYPDDFDYFLTAESGIESLCNEESLIRIFGNISGTLTHNNTSGADETIFIELPDFDLFLIHD